MLLICKKIKYLLHKFNLLKKSGYKKKALLEQLKKTNYTLKMPHRTGLPTKQKLQKVEEEKLRCKTSFKVLGVFWQTYKNKTENYQEKFID